LTPFDASIVRAIPSILLPILSARVIRSETQNRIIKEWF
jgi:hypothetical protein